MREHEGPDLIVQKLSIDTFIETFGTTNLWEHDIAEDGARAYEDEEDQVEQEEYASDDLQGLALVMIWEEVDEGGHDAGTHDHGMP